MSIDKILQKLEDKRLILNWLINGYGRHGLEISDLKYIDRAWLIKHYNVEESYFIKKTDATEKKRENLPR